MNKPKIKSVIAKMDWKKADIIKAKVNKIVKVMSLWKPLLEAIIKITIRLRNIKGIEPPAI